MEFAFFSFHRLLRATGLAFCLFFSVGEVVHNVFLWRQPKRIVCLSLLIRFSLSLLSLSRLRVLILVRVIGASSRDGRSSSSGRRGNEGRGWRGGGPVTVQFRGLPAGQQRG